MSTILYISIYNINTFAVISHIRSFGCSYDLFHRHSSISHANTNTSRCPRNVVTAYDDP